MKDKDGATVATYQYDPFGRRIAKTVAGNSTFFLYGDEGLIAEATPTGSIATEYGWRPHNIWGTDPLFIRTAKMNGTNPEVFYYQNDYLGTPQKAFDAQGNVVWEAKALAFGETAVAQGSTVTNQLRFPGQYEDPESRAYYNYFRDYSPQGGRYLQKDPIGLRGGINIYTYVLNKPIKHRDPKGLDRWGGPSADEPDYQPCSYYGQVCTSSGCKYHCSAQKICNGQNRIVNAIIGLCGAGGAQLNCIRRCLVEEDKNARKNPDCQRGPAGGSCENGAGDCTKSSCINNYHLTCFSRCNVSGGWAPFGDQNGCYGGNWDPIGVGIGSASTWINDGD